MAKVNSTAEKYYGVIYCIAHVASGRVYIGQTTRTVELRWRQHQYYAATTRVFGSAILEYGAAAFQVSLIATAECKAELDRLEIQFIKEYDSANRVNGFNCALGGGSGKHSDETKKHISKIKMGHPVSAEARQKISLSQIGRTAKDSTKALLSAARLGRKFSPETCQRMAAAQIGKKHTEEARKKQSEARKKTWEDPALREKVYAAQIAGKANPEYRAAAAEKSRAIWSDPDKRAAMLKALEVTREAGNAVRKAVWADPIKKAARLEKIAATRASKRSLITS
jgi:group I intron endonuclease